MNNSLAKLPPKTNLETKNILRQLSKSHRALGELKGFSLGKIYDERIESEYIRIFNILTRPEIEILIIINEGHYDKFTNSSSNVSASSYCKDILKFKKVKSKKFILDYFGDVELLIDSIRKYNRLHRKNDDYCFYDLLK